MGDHRRKKKCQLIFFYNDMIVWSHTLKDSHKTTNLPFLATILKWRIPQSRDLTDAYASKRDFSRKTNLEGDQCRQLAVPACVMFKNDENLGGNKNTGQLLWNRRQPDVERQTCFLSLWTSQLRRRLHSLDIRHGRQLIELRSYSHLHGIVL